MIVLKICGVVTVAFLVLGVASSLIISGRESRFEEECEKEVAADD